MKLSIETNQRPSVQALPSTNPCDPAIGSPTEAVRTKYRQLCEHRNDIPIFSQAWWLDATAGRDNWNVCLIEEGGRIIAAMPYAYRRIRGFPVIVQPKLTQTAGPWFAPMDGKPSSVMSRQMRYMAELIDQLPLFSHFQQNWKYLHTNWLPFRWRGFSQSTSYTYLLPRLDNLGDIWNGFQSNIRTDIQKAERRLQLCVRDDLDLEVFLELNRHVFARQGLRRGYSDDYVRQLDVACRQRLAGKTLIAVDPEGRPHAGVYLVWDEQSAYYLMGGGDPALRNSGATSLCLWHAIRFASTVTQSFDFEGSVLEPVERFFRAFGAEQKPYLTLTKTPSHLLATFLFLRSRRTTS
ncbi:GNAT family N-acetyltransferase (plasmid) [Cupriavidus sp. P-10]|uniref:GNAT family N-acetyltransferase n=1 Tax=Cupriavidus sp. P-10 TaxID=2027911 RepID=UPI000E2FB790|nr:GNAT family N-acetyltransferase [Cupriavidus sp. P-10]BDB29167.1 GNAT family N-acetyltransferase [Cupriavidus sp. P-10]